MHRIAWTLLEKGGGAATSLDVIAVVQRDEAALIACARLVAVAACIAIRILGALAASAKVIGITITIATITISSIEKAISPVTPFLVLLDTVTLKVQNRVLGGLWLLTELVLAALSDR